MTTIDCRRPCQFVFEPPPPDVPADANNLYLPPPTPLFPTTKADVDETNCLPPFIELLGWRHGLSPDTATVISLAVLSAVIGPGRTLKNPLGGSVSAAFNIIIEDATNAAIQRAARQALLPFQQHMEQKIAAHLERGPKHLRQLRAELDEECARAVVRLHSPTEKVQQPHTIPRPAEERKREALDEAIVEAEEMAGRVGLFRFEERPFVMVEGLSARDIPVIPQRSFDGAIFNFLPHGGALWHLETKRLEERQEVLRYLVAAWHGTPFITGSQAIIKPLVTNLWLLAFGDTARAARNPTLASCGLLETFLVVANDGGTGVDPKSFAETVVDENWRTLINIVLGERIVGEACEYRLSEPAVKRFLEYQGHGVRHQTASTRKFVTWWPEQTLKIVLLLHLACLRQEVPEEIDLATLENAVTVMETLGAAQLRLVESMATSRDDLEVEVEIMAAKIRVHGPLRKRDLFRKYNAQQYGRLEPILARCCDRNQVRLDGDLIYPALQV